jgi:very-short-patch-repair endonuclease
MGYSPSLAKGWIAAWPQDGVAVVKLPENKDLKSRARDLRNKSTLAEELLWNKLKRKSLGVDFDRQKIIGNFIVDFYCPQLNFVIEIDGCSHDNKYEYDVKRHDYLVGLGLLVIRFEDQEVKFKMDKVLEKIVEIIVTTTPALRATPSPAKGIYSH